MGFNIDTTRTLTNCKKELMKCSTLNEMFDTLDDFYDLDTPVGAITKTLLVTQLGKAVKFTRAKPRDNG